MDAAHIAINRFGLGARPFEPVPADPRAWLTGQLAGYDPALPGAERLAGRAAIAQDLADYLELIRSSEAKDAPAADPAQRQAAEQKAVRADMREFAKNQHIFQVSLRVRSAIRTETPFVERLVHFWANHFAVSADKLATIAFAGLLEVEAIRPHVLGRFEDMLVAVEQHPAMLLYLDQAQSIGPNSLIGAGGRKNGRKIGLNENLGREILELHTLGVDGGYTQGDVTELARALTGWTVAGLGRGPVARRLEFNAEPGSAVFAPALHEPAARSILRKRYPQAGADQARAVLADLARHPATARHLATKLARHFVADEPPASLVARLETAYLASGGDLPTVYRALIDAPEAWAPQPGKFRDPWQWSIAMLRGLDNGSEGTLAQVPARQLTGLFGELGQPVWRPGSPAGYEDVAARWAAPDALYRRIELADRVAGQARPDVDARALSERLFGASLSEATRQTIAQADSPRQGLALLLVAPEMMRC